MTIARLPTCSWRTRRSSLPRTCHRPHTLTRRQLIAAAQRAGADAVHPGYGFLSENAGFAEAVTAAGLIFIGPDAATIRLMGDKIRSRTFAAEHGVPIAPSVVEDDPAKFAAAALGSAFRC